MPIKLADQSRIFPFEYCATRYLALWEKSDRAFHESISDRPTDSVIAKALGHYRVARTFSGLGEPQNLSKIRKALLRVQASRKLTPEERVISLAAEFRNYFSNNLSAASKLLWLSSRAPYVLYDRRALATLKAAGHRRIDRNYAAFSAAWRTEYGTFQSKIRAAIKRLPEARDFMPQSRLKDRELKALASEDWFRERVFDIFLWEVNGGK